MVRWQPPPADAQNGEIVDYKVRYKKGTRKSEPLEITSGNQLSKIIDGKRLLRVQCPFGLSSRSLVRFSSVVGFVERGLNVSAPRERIFTVSHLNCCA